MVFHWFDNGSSVKVRVTSAGILTLVRSYHAQGGNAPSGGFQLADASGVLRPRVTNDLDDASQLLDLVRALVVLSLTILLTHLNLVCLLMMVN